MATVPKKAKKSKKTRKVGHNKKKPCHQQYTAQKRWIRNQCRQIERHLLRHPDDGQAKGCLARLLKA